MNEVFMCAPKFMRKMTTNTIGVVNHLTLIARTWNMSSGCKAKSVHLRSAYLNLHRRRFFFTIVESVSFSLKQKIPVKYLQQSY